VRIVEETFEPGMTVSLVAGRRGVAPNQLFTWHRLGSGEEVVPASKLVSFIGCSARRRWKQRFSRGGARARRGLKKIAAAAVAAEESRLGWGNRLPDIIEWVSDNGSAGDTRSFA
jgi:hypothetical protein